MEAFFFFLFGGLALIGAVLVVFLRRPVHNAVALIFTFFCMAGLYLLLQAEFIAMLQVLIYAGAIMVLFLFVIMLLSLEHEPVEVGGNRWRKGLGVFVAALVFLFLAPVWIVQVLPVVKGTFPPERLNEAANAVWVARLLFTDYLLPFEVASVLLLAAIIGAVFFAMRRI
jgi:NADH-quinone oxidoreductase subunit J